MKYLLLLLLFTLPVVAQSEEDTTRAKPTLPATVEVKGPDAKILTEAQLRLENSQLALENLQLKIGQAQRALEEMQKRLEVERAAWRTTLAAVSKIPSDKLGEYTLTEEGGKYTLARKAQ